MASDEKFINLGALDSSDTKVPEDDPVNDNCIKAFCRSRFGVRKWPELTQTVALVLASILGLIVGLIANASDPSEEAAFWLGFPGTLFLRALKCLVIPMIFCNMVMGISEIAGLGQTGLIGSRTFLLYMTTTFLACVEGLILVLMFKGLFKASDVDDDDAVTEIGLQCSNGKYLQLFNSSLGCTGDELQKFTASVFLDGADYSLDGGTVEGQSISDTIAGIFESLVPANITEASATPDVLSVIMFAIFFGVMASQLKLEDGETNKVLGFFNQLNQVLQDMVRFVIRGAPPAIFFMIAGALAQADDFGELVTNIGVVIVVVLLGHFMHVLVCLPSIFFLIVRQNPFQYMKKCVDAYTFAFGCASSGATLPVTMKCVEKTEEVPTAVSRFALSLGATINMDGSAIYFPACIVFLACVSGKCAEVDDGATLLSIMLVSTLGAVGASPIPNAGLVMIITIWEAVFSGTTIPSQVAYLQAIDWLLDRSVTAVNVCGDSMVARIVTELLKGSSSNDDADPDKESGMQTETETIDFTEDELDRQERVVKRLSIATGGFSAEQAAVIEASFETDRKSRQSMQELDDIKE